MPGTEASVPAVTHTAHAQGQACDLRGAQLQAGSSIQSLGQGTTGGHTAGSSGWDAAKAVTLVSTCPLRALGTCWHCTADLPERSAPLGPPARNPTFKQTRGRHQELEPTAGNGQRLPCPRPSTHLGPGPLTAHPERRPGHCHQNAAESESRHVPSHSCRPRGVRRPGGAETPARSTDDGGRGCGRPGARGSAAGRRACGWQWPAPWDTRAAVRQEAGPGGGRREPAGLTGIRGSHPDRLDGGTRRPERLRLLSPPPAQPA